MPVAWSAAERRAAGSHCLSRSWPAGSAPAPTAQRPGSCRLRPSRAGRSRSATAGPPAREPAASAGRRRASDPYAPGRPVRSRGRSAVGRRPSGRVSWSSCGREAAPGRTPIRLPGRLHLLRGAGGRGEADASADGDRADRFHAGARLERACARRWTASRSSSSRTSLRASTGHTSTTAPSGPSRRRRRRGRLPAIPSPTLDTVARPFGWLSTPAWLNRPIARSPRER